MDLQLHSQNAQNAHKSLQWKEVQRQEKQSRQQRLQPPRILSRSPHRCINHLPDANPGHVLLPGLHQTRHLSPVPPDLPPHRSNSIAEFSIPSLHVRQKQHLHFTKLHQY